MSGRVILKPLRQWTSDKLWTAFLLVDAVHDYGDIKRSNQETFDWFMRQPIPLNLLETIYGVSAGQSPNVSQYMDGLLNFVPSMGSKVEHALTEKLVTELPERMNIRKASPNVGTTLSPMDMKKYKIVPSGSLYLVPCQTVETIMKEGDNDLKKKFLKMCCALALIRLDEKEYPRDTRLQDGVTANAFITFFKQIMVNGEEPVGEYYANYDAAPAIYKYLKGGFTQYYTPLNFLDSATSSRSLHTNVQFVPFSSEPYAYARFLTTKGTRTENQDIIRSIQLTTDGDNKDTFTINLTIEFQPGIVEGDRVTDTINTETLSNGPTLGYLSKLIKTILLSTEANLETNITAVLRSADRSDYNLETFIDEIVSGPLAFATKQEYLCRFLFEWKGFGDAEQVRCAATKLAEIQNVDEGIPTRPTKNLFMATIDENSWTAMRLSGLTACYDHGTFYDLSICPSIELTPGQKAYARFTHLTSRLNEILTLVAKFGNNATTDEMLTSLALAFGIFRTPEVETANKDILESLGVAKAIVDKYKVAVDPSSYEVKVVNFLRNLLDLKLKNVYDFFREVQRLSDELGKAFYKEDTAQSVQVPSINNDKIVELMGLTTDEDIMNFNINGKPINVVSDEIEELLARKETQEALAGAQTILNELSAVALTRKDGNKIVPSTMFQTNVISGRKLVSNPIVRFELSNYKTLLLVLDRLQMMYLPTSTNELDSQLEKFDNSLNTIVSGFYKPNSFPQFTPEGTEKLSKITTDLSNALRQAVVSARTQYANRSQRQNAPTTLKASITVELASGYTSLQKNVPRTPNAEAAQRGGGDCDYTDPLRSLIQLAQMFHTFYSGYTLDTTNLEWEKLIVVKGLQQTVTTYPPGGGEGGRRTSLRIRPSRQRTYKRRNFMKGS